MKAITPDWCVTSVPSLATHYGVATVKIVAWIRTGELTARNIATDTSKRPIFRIERGDWDRFWATRATSPQQQPARRIHSRSTSAVKQYV